MQTRPFGRTGLNVTIAGLGCGGPSRLGTAHGATDEQAADLVRLAIDLGVNYIDTAEAYGTERAVGLAVAGIRDRVILSSKTGIGTRHGLRTADEIRSAIDGSLAQMGVDCIDVYHMHGVSPAQFQHARDVALPVFSKARDAGKIRFLAISEAFGVDTNHLMFQRMFVDPIVEEIDVVMVGFNLLNPSARQTVFPQTMKHNIATEVMFAVRRALSQPTKLVEALRTIAAAGQLGVSGNSDADLLDFLLEEAGSLPEAAYRFCAHEPGVSLVLTGTGNAEHLRDNIRALQKPALSEPARERLRALFGTVECVSGS